LKKKVKRFLQSFKSVLFGLIYRREITKGRMKHILNKENVFLEEVLRTQANKNHLKNLIDCKKKMFSSRKDLQRLKREWRCRKFCAKENKNII